TKLVYAKNDGVLLSNTELSLKSSYASSILLIVSVSCFVEAHASRDVLGSFNFLVWSKEESSLRNAKMRGNYNSSDEKD
ncbi:8191_t:CDS:2, partial [Rhizophagus irregularis]